MRRLRAGPGAGARDRTYRLLRRGMLLRQRDTSLVGRDFSQSAGQLDYRDSVGRAAGTDTTLRVSSGAGEFLLPHVAAQAQKVRRPGDWRVHVHLWRCPILLGVSARRSRPRLGVWRSNVGYAVDRHWIGACRWIDLVAAPRVEINSG